MESFGPGARWFADADELIAAAGPGLRQGVTVFIKGSRVNRLERVAAALSAQGTTSQGRGALMLRYFAEWATQFHSGFNVFGYLTLRAILAALTALAISFIVGPYVIRRLAQHQVGQRVRRTGRRAISRRRARRRWAAR